MTNRRSLRKTYTRAIERYLDEGSDEALYVGYQLGRRALEQGVSLLDVVEIHSRFLRGSGAADGSPESERALEFLMHTLAPLDLASQGFRESSSGLRQQRERAIELAELGAAKDDYFANISHELRTPVSVIGGIVEDGMADERTTPGARDRLAVIGRNCRRLHRLTDDLLDFARIEAGQLVPELVTVDLASLTDDLVQTYAPAATRRGLKLEVSCRPSHAPWRTDVSMWEKILLNLVSNAVKYAEHGTILVDIVVDDDAVLTVRDNGIGIPQVDLAHIFERFHRVGKGTAGAGIGLALVRDLTRILGGTVTARSTTGVGSEFTVRLPPPIARDPYVDESSHTSDLVVQAYAQGLLSWDDEDTTDASPLENPLSSETVLIAEDDADLRTHLTKLLAPHWHILVTTDGNQAHSVALERRPDLVLADVVMPGRSGMDLLQNLRSNASTASTPVVLISARHGTAAAIAALNAGADDYLAKPFSSAELVARVRSNIELARARRNEGAFRRVLLSSIQDGVFVFDSEGTIVEVNPAFTRLTGHGESGLPYTWPHPWLPEDEDLRKTVRLRLASAEPGRMTIPIVLPGGRMKWVALSKSPLVAPHGRQRLGIGTLVDVTSRRFAEQSEHRVAEIAAALAGTNTLDEAVAVTLRHTAEAFDGSEIVLALWRHPDGPVTMRSSSGPSRTPRAIESARYRPPLTVAIVTERDEGDGLNGVVASMAEAVLWVNTGDRPATTDDRSFVGRLINHVAIALQRGRSFDETQEISQTLQRSMLASSAPPPDFAVRYELAVQPLQVGGDWYEIVGLRDGRLGVVIGDCVGSGLAAAAVMGQLRSSARALLIHGSGPAEVLHDLDSVAGLTPGARFTTAFIAIVDPASRVLTYSNAGHVPPIVVSPSHQPRLLDKALQVPLAAAPSIKREELVTTLDPGSVALFYTDGLVERRTAAIDDGISRARAVLSSAVDAAPNEIADLALERLRPQDGFEDDVALVVYRQPATALSIRIDGEADQLTHIRAQVRQWLHDNNVAERIADDLVTAVNEACTNSIEHGYRGNYSGTIDVAGTLAGNNAVITITDQGRWLTAPARSRWRGRGLSLIRALTDSIDIAHSAAGTRVLVTKKIV